MDQIEIILRVTAPSGRVTEQLLAKFDNGRPSTEKEDVLNYPNLSIYPYQRQVFRGEKEIPLTHLEFSVLLYLAQQPGRVFSQQQIFEAVWNEDSDTCRHAVVSIIHQLRKKIEPDPAQPVYIQTVIHTGYKFVIPKE